MGQIVSLFKEKEEPHSGGEAFCQSCKHEWVAVAPVGTIRLECPNCGTLKGLFKFECVRECDHWTCNCGNDLFYVTRDGYYCPNCGCWQNGF